MLQASFELPPVNETGQCIMCRLISHLRCHVSRLGNVMEYQHGAYDFAVIVPYRRSRVFNIKSIAASLYQNRMNRHAHVCLTLKDQLNRVRSAFIGL